MGASGSGAILAMFQISRLEDANVKILPENLGKPRLEAITQEIESLYIDKVIKDLGATQIWMRSLTGMPDEKKSRR